MKRLLLVLSMLALLNACATIYDKPRYTDSCAQSQYFSTTALGCRPYPMER